MLIIVIHKILTIIEVVIISMISQIYPRLLNYTIDNNNVHIYIHCNHSYTLDEFNYKL